MLTLNFRFTKQSNILALLQRKTFTWSVRHQVPRATLVCHLKWIKYIRYNLNGTNLLFVCLFVQPFSYIGSSWVALAIIEDLWLAYRINISSNLMGSNNLMFLQER